MPIPAELDDALDVAVLRSPSQDLAYLLRAGDQNGGISGASRSLFDWNVQARDLPCDRNDFPHAKTSSASQIANQLRMFIQAVERQ